MKDQKTETESGVRLQKWLSEAGLCSRREGERWIAAGRVAIQGRVVTTLGVKVLPGEVVSVDGKIITPPQTDHEVLAFHKPVGLLCTRKDPQGRPTVFDRMGEAGQGLVTVGRLDINSEGLLLLTRDGGLVHALTHPSRQVARVYRARVRGRLDETMVQRLRQGVVLEDGPTGPLDVVLDRVPEAANSWVTVTLREGRNRLVRRIFESLGMEVSRLIRISYGGILLGDIPPAHWRILARWEINLLRQSAGLPLLPRREKG